MNDLGIDARTRTVATSQDRRRSLKTMGVAALAALGMTPRLTAAKGKAAKHLRKCKKQSAPCEAVFAELCEGAMGSDECRGAVAECCGFLRSCNAGAAMECIVDLLLTKA